MLFHPYSIMKTISEKKPLVHHITNWVTIYDCANITRAFGALPVMAHAEEEASDMTGIASSLVLNIGTLTTPLIKSMLLSGKKANEKGIPILLDAVGAGATPFRTEKSRQLLSELKIDILKGNAGEIATLAGATAEVRGVESMGVEGDSKELAKKLAVQQNCTVVITGKEDIISSPTEAYSVKNGNSMMGSVVGTGCMAASIIASFASVEKNHAQAAASALSCFGIASELASQKSTGPGSFKEKLYDEVSLLDESKVSSLLKVEKIV